jgi:hypothetical protein
MHPLELNIEEVVQIYYACQALSLGECPTPFDLRASLARKLRDEHPDTADKVEQLDDEDMRFLCNLIAEQQALRTR